MLSREYRLKAKSDFDRIFKQGRVWNGGFLMIRCVDNHKQNSCFAFLVGKKNFKTSVLRNKVRRKISERVRARLSLIVSGKDIVFIAKPGIEKLKAPELDKEIEILLRRAGLFKNIKK